MAVCVLNDVGSAKHLLSRSPTFETPVITPWNDWDGRIHTIIQAYINDSEFSAIEFNEVIWDMIYHFTTQSKRGANVLDGSIFVAIFALQDYCNERLRGYDIQPQIQKLFFAVNKTIELWFEAPIKFVNVLVQTGEEETTLQVFTSARFFMWFNENDLCENLVFNTAIEFEDFEKDLIKQLPEEQKKNLYPSLAPVISTASGSGLLPFF